MSGKNCDEALDRLYEYIDHELPDDDLSRIGEHLNDCPPCTAELRVNVKIKALVGATAQETAPAELRAKILETIAEARAAG